MGYKILVTPEAASELDDAISWYLKISHNLAVSLFTDYVRSRELIQNNPLHFQKIKGDLRRCNLDRFPYKIIYKILRQDEVLILAFSHHRRRDYWKNR